MLSRYCLLFLTCFCGTHWQELIAQNLVKNPSFEIYSDCPKKLGTMHNDVMDWVTPSAGSTDYFNSCSEVMGTPKNFNGEQPSEFGVAYVGFYFYAPNDYREYIQASLDKTLIKDALYKLSFYVSLAEGSDFAIKRLGVQFMEYPVNIDTKKNLSRKLLSKIKGDRSNYLEIKYDDFYSDREEWVLVELEFTAKGTENYMIIGNFKDNQGTQKLRIKRNVTKGSYYYLDMVSIVPVNPLTHSKPLKKDESVFKLDSVHRFKNVLFNFDDFRLIPSAMEELEQIKSYLQLHKALRIEILGHTDTVGSETYNKTLSKKRAAAVARYLMANGIASSRVSFRGLGSTMPLLHNRTAAGRKGNRRVEFRIFKE